MINIVIPESIDIILTSKCNLNCAMCWGPFHNTPDSISTKQWKNILNYFKTLGTKRVIFTGGEPLLRTDACELIEHAKSLGYIVTLSTNTILLKQKWNIINFIDQIGIPIDGSSHEINSLIRLGNRKQYDAAINTLNLLKKEKPNVEITIRTVLNKKNINDLTKINYLLERHIEKFDCWKIYQFASANYGAINAATLSINDEQFLNATNKVITHSKIPIIKTYLNENRSRRYVFIGSDGDVYGVNEAGEYQSIGNAIDENLDEVVKKFFKIYNANIKRA